MIGLNDYQGCHKFRYINLVPHFLNSAKYESICEDMLLFQKKNLQLQLPDVGKKVHNSG